MTGNPKSFTEIPAVGEALYLERFVNLLRVLDKHVLADGGMVKLRDGTWRQFDLGTWDCGTAACAVGSCMWDTWFQKQGLCPVPDECGEFEPGPPGVTLATLKTEPWQHVEKFFGIEDAKGPGDVDLASWLFLDSYYEFGPMPTASVVRGRVVGYMHQRWPEWAGG